MFANLKNKLIEEVKASPSKFQQFANAAQAAVSSSSSSTTPSGSDSTTTTTTATNENFFSITEEDTPQNSPYKPIRLPAGANRARGPSSLSSSHNGAIPRTRKLSNSSMASDVSFRLPSYETPAVFHMQSDLDMSGSEMDDAASTTTAKLDVITKEHLYDAYKSSLERYNKYRCRYTDLAKKYKDLERDSAKARAVLIETQEKAIRRISELREQCALEQQAKAHLEEALRIEMDDMQCKMNAYQTKLKLLGENPDAIAAALSAGEAANNHAGHDSLIDLNTDPQSDSLTTNNHLIKLDDITDSETKAKTRVVELEFLLEERGKQIEELNQEMEKLRKQEEENSLLLAQTKQAIHSELENKESEVKKLKNSLKNAEKDLQTATKKEMQLTGQLGELKEMKEKMTKLQAIKQELDAKVIASEHILSQLKEQYAWKEKALNAAEEKFTTLTKESEQKLLDLRQQNSQLNEMVQRFQQSEVSLAEVDNELNRTKNENDNLRKDNAAIQKRLNQTEAELASIKTDLETMQQDYKENQKLLTEETLKTEELLKKYEEQRAAMDLYEQKCKQLEAEIKLNCEQSEQTESETLLMLRDELRKTQTEHSAALSAIKEQLVAKEKEAKAANNKVNKQKKQHDIHQHKIKEQNEEIGKLKENLQATEEQLKSMEKAMKIQETQSIAELAQLKKQITTLLNDVTQMEEQLNESRQLAAGLQTEKLKLETQIENLQRNLQEINEEKQNLQSEARLANEKLKQLEIRTQNIESENTQLSERNCLLAENTNRLEKQLVERERQQVITDEAANSAMRLKLETAEDTIQKLNEKISKVLDENSRMQNTQELMDHDYRSLQDKYDILEKEKLVAQDALKCLEAEVEQLRQKCVKLETQQTEAGNAVEEQRLRVEATRKDIIALQQTNETIQQEKQILATQLNEILATHTDDEKLQNLLQEKQQKLEKLQQKVEDLENAGTQAEIKKISELQSVTDEMEKQKKIHEETINELQNKTEQIIEENLQQKQQLDELNEILLTNTSASAELRTQLQELEALKEEYEITKVELNEAKTAQLKLSQKLEEQSALLQEKLAGENSLSLQLKETEKLQSDCKSLKENEQVLRLEFDSCKNFYSQQIQELETKLSAANADVEKLHESNDALQVEYESHKTKDQLKVAELEDNIKQLRNECELLHEEKKKYVNDAEKLSRHEQLQIENEYLNKYTKQLDEELKTQKLEQCEKEKEITDLKEKLKSLQCELYVLKENTETHTAEIANKEQEIQRTTTELEELRQKLNTENIEFKRIEEHSNFITEQNDAIQKELLHAKNQLTDTEERLQTVTTELNQMLENTKSEIATKDKQIESLRTETEKNRVVIETLSNQVTEITAALQAKEQLQEEMDALLGQDQSQNQNQNQNEQQSSSSPSLSAAGVQQKVSSMTVQNVETPQRTTMSTKSSAMPNDRHATADAELLRKMNETLQRELEDLKHKTSIEAAELKQEMEDLQSNNKEMTERIMEYECLQAGLQAQKLLSTPKIIEKPNDELMRDEIAREKEQLEIKLREIMNDVQEVSNRNVFLEQQCENFLILEQSNERLKLQNAKLSRQLDETLVSMQHNESMTANTEFEYLKNIMFQYLTGSANGNNETLVKVISAVLKFSPQQTQVAIEKEHQRRSLINKIL